MAAGGASVEDILTAYFPGTVREAAVSTARGVASSCRLDLVLPLSDEAHRRDLELVVNAGMRDIARRTGSAVPPSVRFVFHPTVASYCRRTGQPWWTAASTSAARVDLLPVSILGRRGILQTTIRHELAHVLTARALSERPAWVKEGAALYLSGEYTRAPRDGTGAKAGCPSDDELGHSRSAAALRGAYARAAACYAAQIAAGRSWDEVR
jgi:hypothetical protein